MLDIQMIDCGGRRAACHVFGGGRVDVVIEMGLGAVMGEWWHVAQRLSQRHTVLLYERAGYGGSDASSSLRTPANIARELMQLLDRLPHEEKLCLIGHSQGGLYAQQFARLHPERVRSLILLDPLTAEDNRFRELLTPEEFRRSGVDKFSHLGLPRMLARLHLGVVLKAMMKNAPPLYYDSGFSDDARAYILDAQTKPAYYDTAMEEYRQAHREENVAALREARSFPNIPLVLITHSSVLAEKETMEFGGASAETARKVEGIWQELMKHSLTFTEQSRYLQAEKSTHYIHLMQPELVEQALEMSGI